VIKLKDFVWRKMVWNFEIHKKISECCNAFHKIINNVIYRSIFYKLVLSSKIKCLKKWMSTSLLWSRHYKQALSSKWEKNPSYLKLGLYYTIYKNNYTNILTIKKKVLSV